MMAADMEEQSDYRQEQAAAANERVQQQESMMGYDNISGDSLVHIL